MKNYLALAAAVLCVLQLGMASRGHATEIEDKFQRIEQAYRAGNLGGVIQEGEAWSNTLDPAMPGWNGKLAAKVHAYLAVSFLQNSQRLLALKHIRKMIAADPTCKPGTGGFDEEFRGLYQRIYNETPIPVRLEVAPFPFRPYQDTLCLVVKTSLPSAVQVSIRPANGQGRPQDLKGGNLAQSEHRLVWMEAPQDLEGIVPRAGQYQVDVRCIDSGVTRRWILGLEANPRISEALDAYRQQAAALSGAAQSGAAQPAASPQRTVSGGGVAAYLIFGLARDLADFPMTVLSNTGVALRGELKPVRKGIMVLTLGGWEVVESSYDLFVASPMKLLLREPWVEEGYLNIVRIDRQHDDNKITPQFQSFFPNARHMVWTAEDTPETHGFARAYPDLVLLYLLFGLARDTADIPFTYLNNMLAFFCDKDTGKPLGDFLGVMSLGTLALAAGIYDIGPNAISELLFRTPFDQREETTSILAGQSRPYLPNTLKWKVQKANPPAAGTPPAMNALGIERARGELRSKYQAQLQAMTMTINLNEP